MSWFKEIIDRWIFGKKISRTYWPNKQLNSIEYSIQNNENFLGSYYELHREDGPAKITYYPTGQIKRCQYWVNDKLHNLNGPADIRYYMNGTVEKETYYINDKETSKEVCIVNKLNEVFNVRYTFTFHLENRFTIVDHMDGNTITCDDLNELEKLTLQLTS